MAIPLKNHPALQTDWPAAVSEQISNSSLEIVVLHTKAKETLGALKMAAELASGFAPVRLLPADLLTTSASGLDPHLSPAEAQAQRVAKSRGVEPSGIEQLMAQFTEGRDWGFLGEPRVNVLRLNLALDASYPVRK